MPGEKKTVPVVCAILQDKDRVLVARRPMDKLLGGLWEFPGGKVDPGESPEDALHRELMEELGCTVRILATLPAFDHEYDWCIVHLHPYVVRLSSSSTPPQALEHLDLRWVDSTEILGLESAMAPADLPLIFEVSRLLRQEEKS